MKGLLVVLLDIASILALSIAAYQQRHCYAVGGEAVLICAILGLSLWAMAPKKNRCEGKKMAGNRDLSAPGGQICIFCYKAWHAL